MYFKQRRSIALQGCQIPTLYCRSHHSRHAWAAGTRRWTTEDHPLVHASRPHTKLTSLSPTLVQSFTCTASCTENPAFQLHFVMDGLQIDRLSSQSDKKERRISRTSTESLSKIKLPQITTIVYLHGPPRPTVDLVVHHMLQPLVVGGPQEDHRLQLPPRVAVVHHLVAAHLVAALVQGLRDVVHLNRENTELELRETEILVIGAPCRASCSRTLRVPSTC